MPIDIRIDGTRTAEGRQRQSLRIPPTLEHYAR
jgi:hypothetical protein